MPNDLYQWQSASGKSSGGLVHHCPLCFEPLTKPSAKARCLGKHVEQCKRYHALFKKGTSSRCDPCIRADEERLKRHREIAELIRELKEAKVLEGAGSAYAKSSPLTPSALKTLSASPVAGIEGSPLTKKERKAAKKAKKLSKLPKTTVTSAAIHFVAGVLDPQDSETEDAADLERQLLEDPDIKLNRAFHAGTSNRREIRNQFVVKDKRAAKKDDLVVDPTELAGILQLLNVSPLTSSSSAEEKGLYEKLQSCIENHLMHVHNENEALMMRKAGFWRWASKKVYKRLVENGRIRSEKSASSSTASTPSTRQSGSDSIDEDVSTEPDTDITTPSEEDDGEVTATLGKITIDAQADTSGLNTAKASTTITIKKIKPAESATNGWTIVGKPNPKSTKAASGNVTLVHNGGLTNMASPITPLPRRRGFATSYEHLY